MKLSKTLPTLCLTALLAAQSVGITASAAAANEAVKATQEGVYYIQMFYNSGDERFPVQGGSGFFISEDTLLTCEHVVVLDDATENQVKSEAKSSYGSYSRNNLTVEVMLQSDISVEANVILSSEDGDWAVLELTEDIAVTPLTFGNSDECENTQDIYAIGYPSAVSNYETIKEFSREDITTTGGTITKITESGGVELIQHSAIMSEGSSGGPLVDENGAVIGVNTGRIKDEDSDSYFYATSTEQILEMLDQKKISYQRYEGSGAATDDENGIPTNVLIIAIGAVLLLACVILLIVILRKGKKSAPTAPAQVTATSSPMTKIMTLTRMKNGERCVIDKAVFIVGKDPSCDYRIEENSAISRKHAKFVLRGIDCYVSDLNSMNGTFVNGKRLSAGEEVMLRDGDVLKISDEKFTFHG